MRIGAGVSLLAAALGIAAVVASAQAADTGCSSHHGAQDAAVLLLLLSAVAAFASFGLSMVLARGSWRIGAITGAVIAVALDVWALIEVVAGGFCFMG